MGDQKHVVGRHLLEHGEEPLIIQNKVLKLRVELDAVDAVLPHPPELRLKPLILRVEGAAGDELRMGLRLLEDVAVDVLHLGGGGGGGEHQGVADPRLAEHVHQLLDAAVVVGGLGQVKVVRGGHGGLPGDLVGEDVGVGVDDSHGGGPSGRMIFFHPYSTTKIGAIKRRKLPNFRSSGGKKLESGHITRAAGPGGRNWGLLFCYTHV